jgi:hypothetical protein
MNLKGTVFYMIGLVALVYGSSNIPSTMGWLLMLGGALSLVVFWIFESHSAMPVIDTKLFVKNRLFAFSNLAALINYSATFAIVFLMSLYLQKIMGLSPRDAGTILIAQPIVMAIFSPIAGRFSDRIEPRYLATAGMNTIMSSVSKTQYGLASGTAATMRVIGQIVSMTIATLYFAGFMGSQTIEIVPDHLFISAVRFGFVTFAFISLAGIYFSYNRGKIVRS